MKDWDEWRHHFIRNFSRDQDIYGMCFRKSDVLFICPMSISEYQEDPGRADEEGIFRGEEVRRILGYLSEVEGSRGGGHPPSIQHPAFHPNAHGPFYSWA